MLQQHTGRPGTPVIAAGWEAGHAPAIAKTLTSTVKVRPASTLPGWNTERGQTETSPAVAVYEGPASLMPVSDTARALTVVDDPVKTRVYDVLLPYAASADITSEHVIDVDPADPDPALAGKRLRIHSIERGTRRFSRVLLATLVDD